MMTTNKAAGSGDGRPGGGRRWRAMAITAVATLGIAAPLVAVSTASALPPSVSCGIGATGRGTFNGKAGTFTRFDCTDGSSYYTFTADKAPIIESIELSGTSTSRITARLHSTLRFQILVNRIVAFRHGQPPSAVPKSVRGNPKSTVDVQLARVGTVALGPLHKGLRHISFGFTPGGHRLAPGSYELSLQALLPTGAVKSSSSPVFVVVHSDGSVTTGGL